MDDFDIFYINNRRPNSHPLTQVDFFHAKHRAIKEANVIAAARGLPPRKSAAVYIDMAVVRNFDHYDDIGAIPDDPVARELVRRQDLETVEADRQGKSVQKLLEKREKASEARKEETRRAKALRTKEELQHSKAWEETRKRVREAYNWQSKPRAVVAPPIHAPKTTKRRQIERDECANKEHAVNPVVDNNREKEASNKWLAKVHLPSTESDEEQENSPCKGRRRRVVLDSDEEEEEGTPSTVKKGEDDIV